MGEGEWSETSDGVVEDTNDVSDVEESFDIECDNEENWDLDMSGAQKAAEYVRSFEGYEKAADYVERHFEGDDYNPGDVINISTRNQGLEGETMDNGVEFIRKDVELEEGLTLQGVFPKFEGIYEADIGKEANDMSLHQQFSACKENFLDHMYDDTEWENHVTLEQMDNLERPQGYTPEGYTWNHEAEIGRYVLVPRDVHASVGHTGANSYSGRS